MYSKSTKLIVGLLLIVSTPTFAGQASVSGLMKLPGFKNLVLTIGKVNSAMRIAAKNPMDKWRRKAVHDAMRLMPIAIMGLAKEFKSGKLHDDDIQRVLAVLGPFVDVNAPARFKSFLENPKEDLIPAVGNQFPKEYLKVSPASSGGENAGSQGSAVDEFAGNKAPEKSKDVLDLKKLPTQGSLKLNNLHPLLAFAESFMISNVWAYGSNDMANGRGGTLTNGIGGAANAAASPKPTGAGNSGNGQGPGKPCAGGCDEGSGGGGGGSGGGGGGKGAEVLMAMAIAMAAIIPAVVQANADKEIAQTEAESRERMAQLQSEVALQSAQMQMQTAQSQMAQSAALADSQRQQQQQALAMQYQEREAERQMMMQRDAEDRRYDQQMDMLKIEMALKQQNDSYRIAMATAQNTQGVGQIINSGNSLTTQPLTGGVVQSNTGGSIFGLTNNTALTNAQNTQQRALGQRLLASVNNGLPSAKKAVTSREENEDEKESDPKKKALKKNLPKVSKALKQNLGRGLANGSTAAKPIQVAKTDLTQQRPTFAESMRRSSINSAIRQPTAQATSVQTAEGYNAPALSHRGLQ